jgi:hypothetical protein
VTCWRTTCAGARAELGRGWSGLTHPDRTLRRAQRAWPAWQEVLGDRPAPHTSLNHPVGTGRRLAIIRSRLDHTKQIAHAHHATVNDVILAAVAGGLRELLASRGEDIHGLVQRAMVTISLHEEQPEQARGNWWLTLAGGGALWARFRAARRRRCLQRTGPSAVAGGPGGFLTVQIKTQRICFRRI